jgi:trk system potassium uptake protein TrkH
MQVGAIFRILGVLLMIFSLSMLPPVGVALFFGDGGESVFLLAFSLTMFNGFLLWLPFHRYKHDLNTRDGFVIVVLFWVVLSLYGSLPFLLVTTPHISFTDAIFESVSGLTTTGASVLSNLDLLPHGLRYYRQQLQFLGGMGIIVLAVAILPMLGVGGMQLYRAETPGPMKDAKLTPRITATAKVIWIIYVGLSLVCALAYKLAGLSWFEAIGESFATISTGGFNMHDTSFAYYQNDWVMMIGIVFMLLGGTNFALHYMTFAHIKKINLKTYWHDAEFRAYVLIILGFSVLTFLGLWYYQIYKEPGQALLSAVFNVTSMLTSTGYITEPFGAWPSYIPILLTFAALIGGCGGSTSGGVKVIRILLLLKQGQREIKRLIHPNAIVPIRLGRQTLTEPVVQAMWAFLSMFFLLFSLLLLALMACGLDLTSAFGALTAAMANAGTGIGTVAESFAHLTTPTKWILLFGMLLGRLEVFTILVLFSSEFWKS